METPSPTDARQTRPATADGLSTGDLIANGARGRSGEALLSISAAASSGGAGLDAQAEGCPGRVPLPGLGCEQFRDRSQPVGGALMVSGGVEILQ